MWCLSTLVLHVHAVCVLALPDGRDFLCTQAQHSFASRTTPELVPSKRCLTKWERQGLRQHDFAIGHQNRANCQSAVRVIQDDLGMPLMIDETVSGNLQYCPRLTQRFNFNDGANKGWHSGGSHSAAQRDKVSQGQRAQTPRFSHEHTPRGWGSARGFRGSMPLSKDTLASTLSFKDMYSRQRNEKKYA